MPELALHEAGLVLTGRKFRSVRGGPIYWRTTKGRRASQGAAGGWSGHFILDAVPDAFFDITQWIDRDDPNRPVRRYSYQVRFCNGLRGGVVWQYRLDYHPLATQSVFVPHYHDQAARDDEHDPRAWNGYLTLAAALPILDQHLYASIGECSMGAPGFRGRAPHMPLTQ